MRIDPASLSVAERLRVEEGAPVVAGETFIVWDDATPAATITVARAYAGRGLGAELLDWAGNRAATTNRKL